MTLEDFYKKVDRLSETKDFESLHDELDSLYTQTNNVVANVLRIRTLREIDLGDKDLTINEKIELLEKVERILHEKINYRKEVFTKEQLKSTSKQNVTLEKYRSWLLKKIEELEVNSQTNRIFPITSKKKNIEDQPWFKAGLLIADGTIYELVYNEKLNFNEICDKLGLNRKTFRSHFSATVNHNKGGDKNLYNNKKKYIRLYNHCCDNKIKIHPKFIEEGSKFLT